MSYGDDLKMELCLCLCGWIGVGHFDLCPSCGIDLNLLSECWREWCKSRNREVISDEPLCQGERQLFKEHWERHLASKRMEETLSRFEVCQHCLDFHPCKRIPIQIPIGLLHYGDPSFVPRFDVLTLCVLCEAHARDNLTADLLLESYMPY